MKDVAKLRETKTESNSERYYGSVGKDVSVGKIDGLDSCPSIGYILSYSSLSNIP